MLSTALKQELQEIFWLAVAFDVPLSQHTSIRIGGPADAFIWPADEAMLQKTMVWVQQKDLPYFVLGKGSNTLVRDLGFRGIIISLEKAFRHFGLEKENGHGVWIAAQGGVPTQQLVRWSIDQGLTGLERLAGVPGTIGGNVFMNAGTYLGEVGELVEEVKLCDSKGKIQVLSKEKLQFEYRKSNIPPSSVILGTVLKLEKGDKEKIEKGVREVFEKRGLAQPIEVPNLGSVFKNPAASAGRQGKKKVWELIEEVGLKGIRVGRARVSEKHANFIVNEGGAKAKDVLILIGMIRDRVQEATGILLETEVKVIGE